MAFLENMNFNDKEIETCNFILIFVFSCSFWDFSSWFWSHSKLHMAWSKQYVGMNELFTIHCWTFIVWFQLHCNIWNVFHQSLKYVLLCYENVLICYLLNFICALVSNTYSKVFIISTGCSRLLEFEIEIVLVF